MDKPWILFSSCCWCLALIIIVVGALLLDDALEENNQKIETDCVIDQAIHDACTYDCECEEIYNKYSGTTEEVCETCDAYLYKYTATSIICNTQINSTSHNNNNHELTAYLTLHQEDDDDNGECGTQIKKEQGEEMTCWANCETKSFTIDDPVASITTPVVLLSVGGFLCLCGAIPPFVMK